MFRKTNRIVIRKTRNKNLAKKMYRLEVRKHLRVPGMDYKKEKQEVLQKELDSLVKQVSEMAIQMVTQQAPTNPDSVNRRGSELREIDSRQHMERLLQKARVLAQKTTSRKHSREKVDGWQTNKDKQDKKRDGKRNLKKRGREENGTGLLPAKRARK